MVNKVIFTLARKEIRTVLRAENKHKLSIGSVVHPKLKLIRLMFAGGNVVEVP